MLNSVPIEIGGEKYLLQFSAIDVDEMESIFDKPLVTILNENQIKRIGVLGTMLYAGLKKNGLPGPPWRTPPGIPARCRRTGRSP